MYEILKQYSYLLSEIDIQYHNVSVQTNLSDSAHNILYVLMINDGHCQQSEIYKQMCTSRQTINSSLHKLEKEGIVRLEPGAGRNTVVYLTDFGLDVAREKVQPVIDAELAVFHEWSEEERELFFTLNRRFCDALKEKLRKYLT